MLSLLKEYYKELWGYDVISNNRSFLTYSFPKDSEVGWINDLYVAEDDKGGLAVIRDLANRVEKIAKKNEKIGLASHIILVNSSGAVHSNPTRIVKLMLYWGMKIVASDRNIITLYKALNEKED